MHLTMTTVLVVSALIGSIVLVMKPGDRLVPGIALAAAAIFALIDLKVLQLSAKYRPDLILSAVLTIAGAICWSRSGGKSAVTAATVVTLVGAIMLISALHVLR